MADYVWHGTNERIARAVLLNPYRRVSEIMQLARVYYADVHRAIVNGIIESDGEPVECFTVTEKGKVLVR